jgi:predicted metal-dependent hydrolase
MMLIIAGIPVEVCKKNVKGLRLYVKPPDGKVLVSAPHSMSIDTIDRFVCSKIDWIKDQILRFKSEQRQSSPEYVSGEKLFVWGESYFLQTKTGKKNSLELFDDKAVFTVRRGSTLEQREKFVRQWYKKILTAEIEKVLPIWENKTGLITESWQTRHMTSRWGSCKIKQRKICLSLMLAKRPPQCLEYIILHELLHFVERNHNERFKSLLNKYMPAWKDVRAILNKPLS